jgi:hypothetical protein
MLRWASGVLSALARLGRRRAIPPGEWEWFGSAAHFCCGRWCRFHMATRVGPVVVSTLGEYVHPSRSGGSERAEAERLGTNRPGEDVGHGRKYETAVFRAGPRCGCGCGVPEYGGGWLEVVAGYATAAEATAGHRAACERWSRRPGLADESSDI